MERKVYQCKVLSKREIAPSVIDVTVLCPEIAGIAKAGQFLHIKCGDEISMPLRRPISICDTDGECVRFIFEVKGRGTTALNTVCNEINIMGPLGNPFTIDNNTYSCPVVIGGGIGAYPLLKLVKNLDKPTVYLGFRSKSQVTLEEDFRASASVLEIATDDGSYGYHGFAADLLRRKIEEKCIDIIYACGPKPMLKAIKVMAEDNHIPCQISLEERMGCGIGACLTCSCETTSQGTWKYKRVCKNGPVFWSKEVIL